MYRRLTKSPDLQCGPALPEPTCQSDVRRQSVQSPNGYPTARCSIPIIVGQDKWVELDSSFNTSSVYHNSTTVRVFD